MIVRESPKAKLSPNKNPASWPPKSPYEALLSSPSGKKKWEDRRDRARERTPSPTPRRAIPSMNRSPFQLENRLDDPFKSDAEDDDEDEETLQLKLKAIEAKLKLKKLQQAKQKQDGADSSATESQMSPRRAAKDASQHRRQRYEGALQVPVSPTKRDPPPIVHTSPARVLLGIDKGLKAHDVSLKRARPATALSSTSSLQKTPPRAKSFTQRLAESRKAEDYRAEKAERIHAVRGRGFGVNLNNRVEKAVPTSTSKPASDADRVSFEPSFPEAARKKSECSDTSVTAPTYQRAAGRTGSVQSQPKVRPTPATSKQETAAMSTEDALSLEPLSGFHLSKRLIDAQTLTSTLADKELYSLPRLLKEVKSPDYYPPDCESDYVVLGIIASRSAPYEVTTGPKSKDSEPSSSATDKKFLVLKLTDLNWEVDLFLFGTAFTAYYRLQPGTVVAILNPAIMPPRPHAKDTGRFSLKLATATSSTSADSDSALGGGDVLELGTARDLGFCASITKSGAPCPAWLDARRAQHCDFHVGLALDRSRAGRMEVNSVFRYTGASKRRNGRDGSPEGGGRGRGGYFNSYSRDSSRRAAPPEKGDKYRGRDAESGETYFLGPEVGGGASAAKLLDAAEDLAGPEKMRRRLAERAREREVMRKLGRRGQGAGAEYLRAGMGTDDDGVEHGDAVAENEGHGAAGRRGRSPAKRVDSGLDGHDRGHGDWELDMRVEEKQDAAALGLVGRAGDVRLSPVKGRRKAPHEGAEALGWSGAFKRGLLEERSSGGQKRRLSPEKGQIRVDSILMNGTERGRSLSPKKKARFALDKGIREPGRESLGDAITNNDDSDDDLDII